MTGNAHRCARCRRRLNRGGTYLCRITERAAAVINRAGTVRFLQQLVVPFCPDCEHLA